MPLNPTVFADALTTFGTTNDVADARTRHAAAFREYMSGLLIAPPVTPAQHDAAKLAMEAALIGQEQPAPVGLLAVNTGYYTYVTTLIAALAGAWIPAIPPLLPGPFPSAPPIGFGAIAYAQQVHNWVTQISGGPPATPPTNWS